MSTPEERGILTFQDVFLERAKRGHFLITFEGHNYTLPASFENKARDWKPLFENIKSPIKGPKDKESQLLSANSIRPKQVHRTSKGLCRTPFSHINVFKTTQHFGKNIPKQAKLKVTEG